MGRHQPMEGRNHLELVPPERARCRDAFEYVFVMDGVLTTRRIIHSSIEWGELACRSRRCVIVARSHGMVADDGEEAIPPPGVDVPKSGALG